MRGRKGLQSYEERRRMYSLRGRIMKEKKKETKAGKKGKEREKREDE